jgi:SAM-dependent methyltransferase
MTMMMSALLILILFAALTISESFAPIQIISVRRCTISSSSTSLMSILPRRAFLKTSLLLPTTISASTTQIINRPNEAIAAEEDDKPFHTAAYTLKEYTNSIVASRDTNISPKEVYDTIASSYLQEAYDAAINSSSSSLSSPRALDVGAGAGVSTKVLYKLGYHNIIALDWSATAWAKYVIDDPTGYCPSTVQFYELDDERYLDLWRETLAQLGKEKQAQQLFDVVIFNFAVNESKAKQFAQELLNKQHGRLLAPINTSNDYWLKQTYQVLNSNGDVLWSAVDVGAWSVQFQPDVTQDTCSGVWCAPFNGFQKKKK